MKRILFLGLLFAGTCGVKAQAPPVYGKWSTHHKYVNFNYDFYGTRDVKMTWTSEFRQHEATGKFSQSNDTLFIHYLPFIEVRPVEGFPGDTLHLRVFRQDSAISIPHADLEVFYEGGKRSTFYADNSGACLVPGKNKIDSIYFAREFRNPQGRTIYAVRKPALTSNNVAVYLNIGAWEISKFGDGKEISLRPDTLLIVNKDKLRKTFPSCLLYQAGSERKELKFNVSKDAVLDYRVSTLRGDVFVLEQGSITGWNLVDTFSARGKDYAELVNYRLRLHSGKNGFRFREAGEDELMLNSKYCLRSFEINSTKPKVKLLNHNITDSLCFSDSTMYELYDQYGKHVQRGYAKTVDCSGLAEGKYYLNYDVESTEIKKMKPGH